MTTLQPKQVTLFRNVVAKHRDYKQGRKRMVQRTAQVPDEAKRLDYVEIEHEGRTRLGRLTSDPSDGVAEFRLLDLAVEEPNAYADIGKRITEYQPSSATVSGGFGELSGVDDLAALGIQIENDVPATQPPVRGPAKAQQLRETLNRWRKQQHDD